MGFEPAHDGSFSLSICAEGFPAYLLPHAPVTHHGPGGPHPLGTSHDEHCLFCNSSASAPAPLLAVAISIMFVEIDTLVPAVSHIEPVHLVHIPQARAPPAFAQLVANRSTDASTGASRRAMLEGD
jgi:hypothetical protein